MKAEDVRFVKELYPRLKEDDAAIERYRDAIDSLPPIAVARGAILVDGYHRWQAHKREGRDTIESEDLGDLSDIEILNESIRRNAKHGQQLSRKDKEDIVKRLWQTTSHFESLDARYKHFSDLLSVGMRSVKRWATEPRKTEKEHQRDAAWDLWLDCHSERDVAVKVGCSQPSVNTWVKEKCQLALSYQPPSSLQVSDLWSFQKAEGEGTYFGKTPDQVLENLLWLYTEPGQVVFDPFAGSGTTIRVAKRMGRRVWSSDLKRSSELLPIHEHDITTGYPKKAPKKVDFVFFDPPYFAQAKGKYPEHPSQLGEIADYCTFLTTMADVLKSIIKRIQKGGHLAFIISATEDEGVVRDNAFELYTICKNAGLTPKRRIVVPFTTQQFTGANVNWAKENKRLLKQCRDVVVFNG